MGKVYENILENYNAGRKCVGVLIDPDHLNIKLLEQQVRLGIKHDIDYFFVGGSLITNDSLDKTLTYIKSKTDIPIILFPGSVYQINNKSDAILFLSLISGRNAELLIGQHVIAAPMIKASGIEVLPTGYMLIDGGLPTTASYVSHSMPIPNNKPNIAAATAMAGELLGLKLIFLDAGSGASKAVTADMIKATSNVIDCPLIVGGGITTASKVQENFNAGANIVVIGNAIENSPELIDEIIKTRDSFNN